MASKKIPVEVDRAIANAKAAGWDYSIRNAKIVFNAPDGVAITMGYNPNAESVKKFIRDCKPYNLIEGPATTPQQREERIREAEAKGLEEADRLNKERRAREAREAARQEAIRAAQKKAEAATEKGLIVPVEAKTPEFPAFDPGLLGTKDASKFVLPDGQFYCIECWQHGEKRTHKGPQGLSSHRGSRHGVYQITLNQETPRVSVTLPEDVEAAIDILRSVFADAMKPAQVDPAVLEAKDAELAELRKKVETLTTQIDSDTKVFEERLKEVRQTAERSLAKAADMASESAKAAHQAEIKTLMENFLAILLQIRKSTEELAPIQAVAQIDNILKANLPK